MVEHVGRHSSRLLPSLIKPQHRFLVAISGIALLAFTTLAVAASLFPGSNEASAQPQDDVNQVTTGQSDSTGGQLVVSYVVPPNAVWSTGFQAQLAITNPTNAAHGWQVTLVYPRSVTSYIASWVDDVPQPSVSIEGQRYIFTSTAPIAAGQTALLRVEFTKVGASDFAPTQCLINGRTCNQS